MNIEDIEYSEDAMLYANNAGLFEEDDDSLAGIYERAGFSGDTHVDVAMRNNCQLHAGLTLLYTEDEL